jgi:hypothetical protein
VKILVNSTFPILSSIKGLNLSIKKIILVYISKKRRNFKMKVYDTVNKVELEATEKELVDIMVNGRQVDLILNEKKTDADGYLTWDVEHWSSIDNKRFIRCYSLEGRVLSESTGHNIYDLANDFKPEEAKEVQLS